MELAEMSHSVHVMQNYIKSEKQQHLTY